MSFIVLGTGHSVPERIVTNDELSTFLDTSDDWIVRRVGVRERRICTKETVVQLAAEAAEKALEMGGTKPEELDMILCATVSGDDIAPSLACAVQEKNRRDLSGHGDKCGLLCFFVHAGDSGWFFRKRQH